MSASGTDGASTDGDRARARTWLVCAWALPNALLVSLINVALPEIQRDFGVTTGSLAWAASGYIVAGAVGAVVYGRLADVAGLRRAVAVCLAGFVLASGAVALAPTFPLVVAARVVQGLFGMALPALGLGGIFLLLPPSGRTRAVALMMAVFGFGLLVGSVGGGLVIEATHWRVPFALAALVAVALAPPTLSLVPDTRRPGAAARFDHAGGALVVVAVGATLLAANQLPRPGALGVGAAAGAVALGAWAAFLAQIRQADHPFVDPTVLRDRSFLLLCGLGALVQALFVGTGFVLPLALRDLFGHSTAVVGLLASLGFAAMLAAGLSGSRLTAALGDGGTIALAVALGAAGALAAVVDGAGHVAVLVASYGLIGAGYSLAQAVLLATAGRMLPPGYSGTGMGFYNFCYFAGGALAVASAGGVVERRLGAATSWTHLHHGDAVAYADAATLLAAVAAGAVVLLVPLWRHPRNLGTSGGPAATTAEISDGVSRGTGGAARRWPGRAAGRSPAAPRPPAGSSPAPGSPSPPPAPPR